MTYNAKDLFQLYQRDPVFVGVFGRMADSGRAGAGYLIDRAHPKRPAGPRIEPFYGEGRRLVAQGQTRSAAGRQIYSVDLPGPGEAVIILSGSQFIVAGHFSKGQVSAEKIQGVAGHIPQMLATAPILAIQVIVGEFVAEVPFHSGPAAHQVAPQMFLTDIIVPIVVLVGLGAGVGRANLVQANKPSSARRSGTVEPFERLDVRVAGLQRWPIKIFVSQQRIIDLVVLARKSVADDWMLVRVEVFYISAESLSLRIGIRVLLAEVPD